MVTVRERGGDSEREGGDMLLHACFTDQNLTLLPSIFIRHRSVLHLLTAAKATVPLDQLVSHYRRDT